MPKTEALSCNPLLGDPVPLLLLLITILTRWPFYFFSVIDPDESTFILLGQSLADGSLPYVDLWDNKPPLIFAFFAAVLMVCKSIVAVRIAGTLSVFVTAYLTYCIGTLVWRREAGLWAAILTIVFISITPLGPSDEGTILSGQATMAEIVALTPVLGALVLVLRGGKACNLFWVGALLSVATLIRTNLGYLPIAVAIPIIAASFGNWRKLATNLAAYVLGGIAPLAAIALPYFLTGNGRLFFHTVFVAPLAFAQASDTPFFQSVLIFITTWALAGAVLWTGFIGGVVLSARSWRQFSPSQKYHLTIMLLFFVAIALSILSTGRAFWHYMIQLVPIMALFAGFMLVRLRTRLHRVVFAAFVLAAIAVPLKPIFYQYSAVAKALRAGQPLRSDPGYQIATYIAADNPERQPVYMMTDHIVYWLLGMPPISRAVTHPSTIGKEYLLRAFLGPDASSEEELANILAKRPRFIVKRKSVWYLRDKTADMLSRALDADYELATEIDGREIYKRLDAAKE